MWYLYPPKISLIYLALVTYVVQIYLKRKKFSTCSILLKTIIHLLNQK